MSLGFRTAVIAGGKLVEQVSSLALVVVLARLLTRESMGTYRQSMMLLALLGSLLAANLPDSMYYFVPKLQGRERKVIVGQTGILIFLQGVVCAVLLFGLAPYLAERMHNPELTGLLRIVSLYPLADMVVKLVPSVMISLDHAPMAAALTVAYSVSRMLAWVIPLGLGLSLEQAGYAFVVVTALVGVVGVVYLSVHFRCVALSMNRVLLRDQMIYILPLVAASLVGIAGRELDKLLISFYFPPGAFAAYSNGAFGLPFINIVTASLTAALMPELVRYGDAGRTSDLLALWRFAARKCALVLFPTFVLGAVASVDIITLLYSDKYRDSVYSFVAYLFLVPLRIATFGAALRALGRTRDILVGALLTMITSAALGIVLMVAGRGSLLSFLGPAVGAVLGQWAAGAFLLRQIRRHCHCRWAEVLGWGELGRILALAAAGGVVAAAATRFLPFGAFVRVTVAAATFTIVYAAVGNWSRVVTPDDLRYFRWRGLRGGRDA